MLYIVGFYKNGVIVAAKEEIFSFCNEHPVERNMMNEHSNPAVINIKDILTILDNKEGKISIPSFVAANFN